MDLHSGRRTLSFMQMFVWGLAFLLIPTIALAQTALPAKIEVEDYNTGGEGVGYHDATPDNWGGEYRDDDVDIYVCTDTGGGYQVATIDAGEWLAFDVTVPATGNYDFTFRVECASDSDHDLHVEMDGTNVTGTVDCHMASWGDVVVQDVSLTAGTYVMKIVFDTNWHNGQDLINYVDIASDVSNVAPTVDAGAADTITLPADATLDGTVTDDGLPAPANLTRTWTMQSGPGTVTFGDASDEDTTASFSTDGTYVLRLTADDSELTAYDEVTITVNPAPAVTFTPASQSAGEDAGTATVTVQLSAASGLDVTIPFTVTGTATDPDDYTITSSPITITAGQTTGTATVTIVDDSMVESDETVVVTMGTPTNATQGATTVHTVTITDNDTGGTEIHIEVEDYNTGGEGVGYHDATPDNWGGEYRNDDVDIYVCTDTGGGYQVATIDAGEWLAFDVTVPATGNYDFTFRVECASDSDHDLHVEMDGTNVTGTVDCHMASWGDVVVQDVSLTAGSQVMRVVFDTNWHNGQDLINYVKITSDGGATNTAPVVDAGPAATITLPAGATLNGSVIDDGLPAPANLATTWTMQSGPGTVTFGNAGFVETTAAFSVAGVYTLALTADDGELDTTDTVEITVNAMPTVTFTTASQSPAESTGTATVTAQLSAASGLDVTVPFTVGGTATDPDDYTISASPITITAGQTTGTATVTIVDDALDEGDETVVVTMGTPTNATQGAITAHTVTITDNDSAPTVAFTLASQSSAESAGTATVTAQLSAASGLEVTVPFTVGGTATDPDDYTITSSPITITAGQTTGTATVTIVDDSLDESDETAIVTMGTPTNATQGATTVHTVTITDNDGAPTVTFTTASQSASEDAGTATVTAELSAASGLDVTVPFTVGGTATDPDDYTITASPITITAGQTTGTATVTIVDDSTVESDETVVVTMGTPTNATQGATTVHTITITDNDSDGTEIHIEAEDYNTGGEGVGYHDATPDNWGGEYRNDDVDIYVCTDTGGGYQVATIDAGEWLAFDVNIPAAGNYDFTFRVECASDSDHDLHVEMDGTNVTGTVDCHMASWGDVVVQDVSLTAGSQVMRVVFDTNWHNGQDLINYVKITSDGGASNTAPIVDAGADDTVTLPAGATLDGTVTDDGLPAPANLARMWTRDLGPGTVVFGDASAEDTTAYFSTDGTYVLRLTGDDGELNAYDTVEITVNPENTAPVVDAGPDDTITLPAAATLDGTVTDDGLPTSGNLTRMWAMQSGPGTVTFGDASAEDTTASFSVAGVYTLALTADDGELDTTDTVEITVNPGNTAPVVDAGADDTITLPADATLDGTVTDDGLPTSGNLTRMWAMQSGPGTVTFGDASAVDTTASFSLTGTYVLRLTADDSELTAYDEVTITVNPAATPTVTFTTVSQSASESAGTATVTAELSAVSGLEVTVPFTVGGTAIDPDDYTITSSPITITAGQTTGTATVTIVDDSTAESSETVIVTMGTPTNATQGATTVHTVTITDNDSGGFVIPCTIQVEDYREGGEGVGYHDTTAGNWGNVYRTDDVDIYVCDDTGGGYEVASIDEGEWLAYDVYVPTTGAYTFTFRLKTQNAPQDLHIEMDDVDVSGTVTSYEMLEWDDILGENVNLTAGNHVMKIVFDTNWANNVDYINYVTITPISPPTVDAGPDQTITAPVSTVTLDATVTDDGLPDPPGELSVVWSAISVPFGGMVAFDDPLAEDTTATFGGPGLCVPGAYVLRLSAHDGEAGTSDEVTITVNDATSRVTLPGRLEAEDYADQGEAISYHDTTSGNAGGEYRTDDVDIESCSDTGGGYSVTDIVAGEWLGFDVEAPERGTYDVVARVSSTTSGRQMHVEVDGVDLTGPMTFDSTGGWTDITFEGVYLTPGSHVIKVVMDTGDFDLNYVDVLAETHEEYIVENGVANADIVIAANAVTSTTFAASELQDIIQRITGATLPIVTTPSSANVHIYVGQSSYTDSLGITTAGLEYDAFKMVSGSDWLALIGPDEDYVPVEPYDPTPANLAAWDAITGSTYRLPREGMYQNYNESLDLWTCEKRGSLNAVYEFLRDLGCRWYYPGTLGETLPDIDDIGLPAINRTVEPDFPLRTLLFYYHTFLGSDDDEVKWRLRMGLNAEGDSLAWCIAHGMIFVYGRDEMKAAHPEYYALIDGVRETEVGGVGLPCMSSTGLLAENVNFIQKVFDHYGDPGINVCPTDGFSYMCQCPLCEGKDTPERGIPGQFSDYIHGYANDVAEEVYLTHPDKKIYLSAYAYARLAPLGIQQFSPNVIVGPAVEEDWISQQPEAYNDYLENVYDWLDLLPNNQILIRGYYLENVAWDDPGNPKYYSHLLRDRLRMWNDGTALGMLVEVGRVHKTDGVPDQPWLVIATQHLNIYLTSRLLWDADLDLEALLDEYYTLFYGPAADEMRAFVEYAETNHMDFHTDPNVQATEQTLLDAAIVAAAGSGIYADRVGLVDDFFKASYNTLPTVDVGPDRTVTLPDSLTLDATVTDDGLPNPPGVTTPEWVYSGPGTVTFGDKYAEDTTASFSAPGTYELALTADDGCWQSWDEMIVTVSE